MCRSFMLQLLARLSLKRSPPISPNQDNTSNRRNFLSSDVHD